MYCAVCTFIHIEYTMLTLQHYPYAQFSGIFFLLFFVLFCVSLPFADYFVFCWLSLCAILLSSSFPAWIVNAIGKQCLRMKERRQSFLLLRFRLSFSFGPIQSRAQQENYVKWQTKMEKPFENSTFKLNPPATTTK